MHHLIGRGKCERRLRWAKLNLLMLCGEHHGQVTLYAPGMAHYNVSSFGNQELNLRAFWRELKKASR